MRAILALMRVAWLTAISYRLSFVLSLGAVALSVVPIYYVANALQGTMANVIRGEGAGYFGFVLFGLVGYNLAVAAANSLPAAIASGIGSGTLESLLATPASTPAVLAGLGGYGLVWAWLRALVLFAGGLALGVHVNWSGLPLAMVALLLVVIAYLAIGMLDAAVVVVFRTRTPLVAFTLTASALLGGVYFPSTAVPAWLAHLTPFVPLSHGARILRRILLESAPAGVVGWDLLMLVAECAVLLSAGVAALTFALGHARRSGTLGQY
jgi:ABC-2 type transport system permease protein